MPPCYFTLQAVIAGQGQVRDELTIEIIFWLVVFAGLTVDYIYLFFFMLKESRRPKDGLTKMRRQLTLVLALIVLTFSPAIVYGVARIFGYSDPIFALIVMELTRVSTVLTLIGFHRVIKYKRQDDGQST